MNLAQLLSVDYAARKRDAAKGLELIVQRWGQREALYQLVVHRTLRASYAWRETYREAVGREALSADRKEMVVQLVERIAARSKRGALPRTYWPDELSLRGVVSHLLDANSLVASDSDEESLSEVLVELLATQRSPELRFVQIGLVRGGRSVVLDAIAQHYECWLATREGEAA